MNLNQGPKHDSIKNIIAFFARNIKARPIVREWCARASVYGGANGPGEPVRLGFIRND